jgi:hypothetical protein
MDNFKASAYRKDPADKMRWKLVSYKVKRKIRHTHRERERERERGFIPSEAVNSFPE